MLSLVRRFCARGVNHTDMDGHCHLDSLFPRIGSTLDRIAIASLPTPVVERQLQADGRRQSIWIKEDNRTGKLYGGNKLRKLEYLLRPPLAKGRERIATFGAAGSHHALATALYARKLGLDATAFLAHQRRTPAIAATLNMHLENGTELVCYGGDYARRIALLRQHLWGRNAWVVPAGGSSWLGTVGFVNAGLELAAQVSSGELPEPARVYVPTGTMSTAAGLGLGFALAGLDTELHAVRVSEPSYARQEVLDRLARKTCYMLNRIDKGFPADLYLHARSILRHEFFGTGYAHSNRETDAAIVFARDQLGIELEATYTGKAMAALVADVVAAGFGAPVLFWNTYHSAPLPVPSETPLYPAALPDEFRSYFPGAR